MADISLLLEAEKRGILPVEKQSLLTEARSRGLIPSLESLQSKSPVDQIPGMSPVTATAEAKPSLYQRVLGAAEVPIGMLGSAIAAPIGAAAGVLGTLTSGAFGTQEGIRRGQDIAERVQRQIYQPITQTGAQNLQAVGKVLEPLGAVPIPTLNALAQGVSAPLRMGTNALRAAGEPIEAALQRRQNTIAAGKVAESYANAPQIEAAQTAQKLKLALNPSVSNPTAATRAISAIGGPEADTALAQGNAARTVSLVKEDIGLKPTDKLNADTIGEALNRQSKPYDVIRAVPTVAVPDTAVANLDTIKLATRPSTEASARAINDLVDRTKQYLLTQPSGAAAMEEIRNLRKQALDVYKTRDKGLVAPSPEAVDVADAKMAITNVYEQILEANVKNPSDVAAMRAARVRMAETYDHLRALDFATEQIDPQAYVKMFNERQGKMTGLSADIAKVAGNYPAVMVAAPAESFALPRLVRGGVGATLGGAIGNAIVPGAGAIPGVALGALGGAFAGNLAARRMASPAYQAKNAMPPDYRGPVANTLAPAAPNTLPVPYTSQGQMAPRQLVTRPNWDYYRAEAPSGVQVGVPSPAAQLAAPSAEATMANVAQQRASELANARSADVQAARAAEAESAATRLPTGRGTVFEVDPNTGGLRAVAPTPTTLAPTSLQSAINKLSGVPTAETKTEFRKVYVGRDEQGAPKYVQRQAAQTVTPGENTSRAPTLTAVEKIAWDRAKATLEEVLPGFNKLSDTQVFQKLLDRQWIADTIKKSREKEAMWAGKAAAEATTDRQIAAATEAAAKHTALMDLGEALETRLREPRPVTKMGQGPKTRAAQRLNQLAPEDAVIVRANALRP